MFDVDGFPVRRKETTLNLTAMIDVIMVLLLFFITSTTFSKLGVKINQPVSSQTKAVEQKNVSEVGIAKDGSLYFENKPLSTDDLKDILPVLLKSNPDMVMILNPDKDTPTQFLITVLDICKEAGVQKISIASKKKHAG